jgi:hypothetical protein
MPDGGYQGQSSRVADEPQKEAGSDRPPNFLSTRSISGSMKQRISLLRTARLSECAAGHFPRVGRVTQVDGREGYAM